MPLAAPLVMAFDPLKPEPGLNAFRHGRSPPFRRHSISQEASARRTNRGPGPRSARPVPRRSVKCDQGPGSGLRQEPGSTAKPEEPGIWRTGGRRSPRLKNDAASLESEKPASALVWSPKRRACLGGDVHIRVAMFAVGRAQVVSPSQTAIRNR